MILVENSKVMFIARCHSCISPPPPYCSVCAPDPPLHLPGPVDLWLDPLQALPSQPGHPGLLARDGLQPQLLNNFDKNIPSKM